MTFNDLLQQVRGVGHFQWIQITLATLPTLLLFLLTTLQNFCAATPTHHCRPPANANLSKDGGLEAWLPRDRQGQPESCLYVTSPQWRPPSANGTEANVTGATEPCIDGWIYDNSTFPPTIVTEWDLVCTHKTLPQLSQSFFMAEVLVRSLVLGTLADRLGHRKMLNWVYLQLAVSGSCAAFTPNFPAYGACRFLSGMAMNSISCNTITLSLGLLIGFVTSLGQFFLAGMACAIPQWRLLQLLFSVPFFVFFIYSSCVGPEGGFFIESAVWYACSGRLDLTLKALKRVAQINGKQEEGAKLSMEVLQANLQKDLAMNQAQPSMSQLLRCPAIRHLSLCLFSLCQRGLSIMTTLANIGDTLSPLVAMTAELYPSLPLFIYSALTLATSTITLLLPDTLGQPLPDTLQDLENRWKQKWDLVVKSWVLSHVTQLIQRAGSWQEETRS
ncbi:solute carrier family 22 member 6-like [Dugong dugon]